MIKKIVRKIIGAFGYELIFKFKLSPKSKKYDSKVFVNKDDNPLAIESHLTLAQKYFEKEMYFPAWASLKTAQYLGLNNADFNKYSTLYQSKLSKLDELPHNQYFRYKTLANEIAEKAQNSTTTSILDVGGGYGNLAAFIPEMDYCLVEPHVNGINGLNLPFKDESFDFVVSCHVLEHIPLEDRDKFLDQLLAKSKKGVLLLNPIYVEKTKPIERIKMIIDITNTEWAKEHLDCTLPTIDYVEGYANKNNLTFQYKPNGTGSTTLSLVLFDFLRKYMKTSDYKKVNRFFNNNFMDILNSEEFPNAGLFYIGRH